MGIFSALKSALPDLPRGPGKIVSILNQKGGVGKTTLAFNIAHALKDRGHRVLCLDMDPQANLTHLCGHEGQGPHIFHLLVNSIRELAPLHTKVLLDEVIVKKEEGVDLLPSGQELSGLELTVAGIAAPRQLILQKFLIKSGLTHEYEYIIIDGPPTLGLLVVNVICASDGVFIPFQPDRFSRQGLTHFHQMLADVEEMGISSTPKVLGHIPNLVEARRKQVAQDFASIREDLSLEEGMKLFEPIANKAPLARSSQNGKSVFAYQSKDYKELQGQFLEMAHCIEESL